MVFAPARTTYRFKGQLCGLLCSECSEPLSTGKVRLYRTRQEQNVPALAVADPKDTFAILTDDMVEAKARYLLAEVEPDAEGNFVVELGETQGYQGEAFDVDFVCGTVPHRKPFPRPRPPIQFSITTLQPVWRQGLQGLETNDQQNFLVASWDYCIPSRYWCAIRARFGAWIICGRVVDCQTKSPIAGVRVSAFDTDIWQDDALGSNITDATGHFRIDYTTEEFQKTPLSPTINFEIFSGPDLYFRVDVPTSGTVLLNEPRLRGRQSDRNNVSNCFCVELCIDGNPETPPSTTIPLFTDVGQYSVDPSDGAFTSEGTTTAGDYAFTGTLPLRGLLPDGDSPDALEYRFRMAEYDSTGTLLGATADVDPNVISGIIAPTVIGSLEYWDWNGSVWKLKSAKYYANNPGVAPTIIHRPLGLGGDLPVTLNVTVQAGGWIRVPRENGLTFGGIGRFVGGNVNLIDLDTTRLTNESYDLTTPAPALKAGESVPGTARSRKHRFRLFFEARRVVGGSGVSSNDLEKIAISNIAYRQRRHPNWAGGDTTQRAVVMLDIAELASAGAGCMKLTTQLHGLYTVYHPFMGSVSVYFEGNPPLPASLAPVPVGGEVVSGTSGTLFDITLLPSCAYILWLQATVRLTSGYGLISDATIWDHIGFCKA